MENLTELTETFCRDGDDTGDYDKWSSDCHVSLEIMPAVRDLVNG
jgi:hypothetical protein